MAKNRYNKSGGIAKAVGAVLVAGLIAAGVCCAGYASRNDDGKWFGNGNLSTWHWSDKSPVIDGDETDKPNGTTGADGAVMGEAEDSGIQLLSALLPREAYEANNIDPQADTAYRLTATVSPENADDKTVEWALAWKNGASSWAAGKSVTDYGTVTSTDESGATANFVCKQGFAEQMVITATSRDNKKAKGTLTVDYRKRLIAATSGILSGDTSATKVWNTNNDLFNGSTEFGHTFGDGTLNDVVKSHTMTITTHTDLRSRLSSVFPSAYMKEAYEATREYNGKNVSYNMGVLCWEYLFVPSDGGVNNGWSEIQGLFSFCSEEYDYGSWGKDVTQYNKLRPCLLNSPNDFVVTIKTELEYGGTHTTSYNVNVLDSSLKIMVNSVDVSDSIII